LGPIGVSALGADFSHSSRALLTSDKRNIFLSGLGSAYAARYRSPKVRNSAFFISYPLVLCDCYATDPRLQNVLRNSWCRPHRRRSLGKAEIILDISDVEVRSCAAEVFVRRQQTTYSAVRRERPYSGYCRRKLDCGINIDCPFETLLSISLTWVSNSVGERLAGKMTPSSPLADVCAIHDWDEARFQGSSLV